MINKTLLNPTIQTFITQNRKTDVARLLLHKSPFTNVSSKELAQQIQGKQKAEKKLPTWFKSDAVLYPPSLNLAQSSSEITAQYKAKLVSGNTLIDITGGLGIDDFYFAKNVENLIHCEQNEALSALAAHNYSVLSTRKNCQFITGDGLQYLQNITQPVAWIYADPGRRSTSGNKVFQLEDCQPDILKHLPLLQTKAHKILLKTSPLLDISLGLQKLKNTAEIHVVSVKNDVKELLWVIDSKEHTNPLIKTINFSTQGAQIFSANTINETLEEITFSTPLSYLYEPNAAILKAGFFKTVAKRYHLFKLAINTHLYTADSLITFPGRCFKIIAVLPAQKKAIQQTKLKKANITLRNFPSTVKQVRKKFNLKDGGDDYLFFTQDQNRHKCIIWGKKA